MQLKLDNSKIYAIALEGGGAKGSYEVGVWQALEEAGIRYNAVSGTSVGALNGAMMAMRDLPRAIACWEDIRLSQIMALDQETEQDLSRLMNGQLELEDLQELLPQAVDIIKDRGLDVAPLRAWVREITDVQAIKNSDVELFVSTVDLTDRRALEIKVNDLPEDEVCNMLLASAYHPSFRLEKLGGKLYADGGFVDTIPIHALVENGYKDIIAVRIPGHGIEKRFRLPEDVSITYIEPTRDLGFVLNFDARQARRNLRIGYLDAQRVLYGLYGRDYYVDRSLSDREALSLLLDILPPEPERTLRHHCERRLPRIARRLDVAEGDYYELLIACLERAGQEKGIDPMAVYSDRQLLSLTGLI